MTKLKEEAIQTIASLPDESDWNDMIEALCLRMTLEARLRDLDAGIYIEHEEAVQRLLHN
jgi:hypothetical protein